MQFNLKRDSLPAISSCLHYGNTGPSCQQVCLVSDQPDSAGEKVYTGVTFLSIFSKLLSSLLKDSQTESDVLTIILPVPVHIIKGLLHFLSTGEVLLDIEDAFSVALAAQLLGISDVNWKIETKSGDVDRH